MSKERLSKLQKWILKFLYIRKNKAAAVCTAGHPLIVTKYKDKVLYVGME